MWRTTPPFRADINGSFLRPQAIKTARQQLAEGKITQEQLRKVEDEEIAKLVAKEEEIGLQVVSDGEFRRSWWHFDFLEGLTGVEGYETETGIQFHGVQSRHRNVRVVAKIDFPDNHPFLDHFRYLKSITKNAISKMTIPSPSVLHFRGGSKLIDKSVYPNLDLFFEDLGKAYRKAIHAFYNIGCHYLQLDDTVWAYLCSEEQRRLCRERGDDPERLMVYYANTLNYALADKPKDLTVSMHICRGNYRSTWFSEGGYEYVSKILFETVKIDAFFLEYDSDRAGGFEPLKHIKSHGNQFAVLGLVTSKSGKLESADDIKARIAEASKYLPKEQLCLSTQCGFASTEEGNVLTEEEMWEKLRFIIKIAKEVWA